MNISRHIPAVSVLMPVYNGERYLEPAIRSILAQSFADFEFVIVDDGSRDSTPEILASFHDPRLRVLRQENRGMAGALNAGLALCRGRFIARMDADDVSYPERFARQVVHLEAHRGCGLVGTWADIWLEDSPTGRSHRHPSDPRELFVDLFFHNPFVHSSVMIRREVFDHMAAFHPTDLEDIELWVRLVRRFEVANIPETLHMYRETAGSYVRTRAQFIEDQHLKQCSSHLGWILGPDVPPAQRINLVAILNRLPHRISDLRPAWYYVWLLERVGRASLRHCPMPREILGQILSGKIRNLHHHYDACRDAAMRPNAVLNLACRAGARLLAALR